MEQINNDGKFLSLIMKYVSSIRCLLIGSYACGNNGWQETHLLTSMRSIIYLAMINGYDKLINVFSLVF